jgi:hypothetical protein
MGVSSSNLNISGIGGLQRIPVDRACGDQPSPSWKRHSVSGISRHGKWSGRPRNNEPLGGGSPVRSVYYVAEQDPAKAEAIIAAMMAPNERIEAWEPLPEPAVKALGLNPGDFTRG